MTTHGHERHGAAAHRHDRRRDDADHDLRQHHREPHQRRHGHGARRSAGFSTRASGDAVRARSRLEHRPRHHRGEREHDGGRRRQRRSKASSTPARLPTARSVDQNTDLRDLGHQCGSRRDHRRRASGTPTRRTERSRGTRSTTSGTRRRGLSATTPPMAIGMLIRAALGAGGTFSNNMISLGDSQTTNTQFVGIMNSFTTIREHQLLQLGPHHGDGGRRRAAELRLPARRQQRRLGDHHARQHQEQHLRQRRGPAARASTTPSAT